MRPSPCGPPSSQCKPGSCPWPTTNRAQLSSDFTTERHRIGLFFQVSIVFRQILNFPPWVKGLTFVFQALFLQEHWYRKNGFPGCPISFWLLRVWKRGTRGGLCLKLVLWGALSGPVSGERAPLQIWLAQVDATTGVTGSKISSGRHLRTSPPRGSTISNHGFGVGGKI